MPGSVKPTELSHSELSQRVAVIKRFKELLKAQRDRFQAYLNTLDKQKDVIQRGTTEDLLHHVELEEKIVADIFSIQKVIDPLDKMYQSIKMESGTKSEKISTEKQSDGDEVKSLKDALEDLKAEAVIRSERNRVLLAKRMAEIRSEIKSLKSNAYAKRNFDSGPSPSLVDLKG
jgi:hypothetical protein